MFSLRFWNHNNPWAYSFLTNWLNDSPSSTSALECTSFAIYLHPIPITLSCNPFSIFTICILTYTAILFKIHYTATSGNPKHLFIYQYLFLIHIDIVVIMSKKPLIVATGSSKGKDFFPINFPPIPHTEKKKKQFFLQIQFETIGILWYDILSDKKIFFITIEE